MRAVAMVGRFLCRALKQRTALFSRRSFYRNTRRARLGYCAPVLARQRVPPAPPVSLRLGRAPSFVQWALRFCHCTRSALPCFARFGFGRSVALRRRSYALLRSTLHALAPRRDSPALLFRASPPKRGQCYGAQGRAFCKALPAPFFFKSQTPNPQPLGA